MASSSSDQPRLRVEAIPIFGVVVRPIQAFFRLEAASGILLLACAVAALAWVNLLGPESYHALFDYPLALGAGGAAARFTVHALVNDGLMTLFFFLVGMEIKRELVSGELRTPAKAALPLVAALGGMIVPAGIYFMSNRSGPGAAGWGVPMATDIAFCIGILTLLRSRVPHALIVFVTALAIFDDIGGILVIAVFYGSGLELLWLLGAAGVTALLVVLGRAQVGSAVAYVALGAALWFALHEGGIHATIAGVVLGLAIPARVRRRPREVLDELGDHVEKLLRVAPDAELDAEAVLDIEERLEELTSPLARFEHALHPWVAFGIMPVFALANSGVDLRALDPAQLTGPVTLGIGAALVVGKLVGVFVFTFVAVKAGLSTVPGGASLPKLLGVSVLTGVGFTVALFIAGLAFPGHPELLDQAKVGILGGSFVAGALGAAILRATAVVIPDGRAAGPAAAEA